MKPSLLTEVRDWFNTAATGIGLYLTWRWRQRNHDLKARPIPRHHVLHLADSVTFSDTLVVDTGTHAVLDSMAELDPDFPQF